MPTHTLTVVVSGANRGLGLAIVQQLVKDPPLKPLLILACARRTPPNNFINSTSDTVVKWCTLDVSNKESIDAFATTVNENCGPTVDVLINNAGINLDITSKHGLDSAQQTIDVNYDGTVAMTEAILPLMRRPALKELRHCRVVNLSSVGSKLSNIPDGRLRQKLRYAQSKHEVQVLRDSYLSSVAGGSEGEHGWPIGKSYSVSKALLNSWTQILAANQADLLINACCPGWCKTDMGSLVGLPSKSAEDGTKIPLRLAFGNINDSGKYWENPSVYDTGDGRVAEWFVRKT